jgi:hypothetical protein
MDQDKPDEVDHCHRAYPEAELFLIHPHISKRMACIAESKEDTSKQPDSKELKGPGDQRCTSPA